MAIFNAAEYGLRPVTLSPEEEASLSTQPVNKPLDPTVEAESVGLRPMPMEKMTADELFTLADESRGQFDPVSYFYANRDRLYADPANVEKFAEVLDRLEFKLSDLPVVHQVGEAAEAVAKGDVGEAFKQGVEAGKEVLLPAWHFVKGGVKQVWNYANALAGRDPQRRVAENWAGSELAVTGLAQQAERFAGKITRPFLGARTQDEKIANLWSQVGHLETQEEIARGHGGFLGSSLVGKYVVQALEEKGKAIRPEESKALAAGDPLSLWAFTKIFQGVHKATPAAVGRFIPKVEAVVGRGLERLGGRAVQVVGKGIQGASVGAKVAAPFAPAVGAAVGAAKGGWAGAVMGATSGTSVAATMKKVAARGQTWGSALNNFGRDLRTGAPLGSYGQLARDLAYATPKFAAELAKGAAVDVGLAAATSETPAETANAATLGTVFGLGRGAYRAGTQLVSGQIVAPRPWKPISVVQPSSGKFPGIERMHQEAYHAAPPGVKIRIDGIRDMLQQTGTLSDLFYTPTAEGMTRALVELGQTPADAARNAAAQGIFLVRPGGRRVVVVRGIDAAPHESFHPIQDVLGETGNRAVDEAVRNSFTPAEWESYGRDQTARLLGVSADDMATRNIDWREALLDRTGWGEQAALEQIAKDTPDTMRLPIESPEIQQAAGEIATEMIQNQGWRQAVKQSARREIADRYIARELAADQWDAVLNNLGPSLKSNSFPATMARAAAGIISFLGGEPLAERVGYEGVPLRYEAVKAVTKAAKGLQPEVPVVTPRVGAPPAMPRGAEPMTPEQVAQAAQEARDVAASAPDQPLPGQTQSQREMLGAVAEGIAGRSAVMADYRSAQGLPAGDPASEFLSRRAEIEAARNIPETERASLRKIFFPYRVEQRGGGKIQVLGYSPEVVASNAIRWTKALSDLAVKDPTNAELAKVPYELDLQAGEFTARGWTSFIQDLQIYSANQLAGRTGAGTRVQVPEGLRSSGFFPPLETGTATPLGVEQMNFLNIVHGQKPPVTPRVQAKRIPGAIASEEVSAATMPGRVVPPALVEPVRPSAPGGIRKPFAGPEAERLGVAGRNIMEVNPMRAALEKAMQAREVPIPQTLEAMQRLNLEHFVSAAPEPLQPRTVGANILTQRAGFKPAKRDEPAPKKLSDGTGSFWMDPQGTAHKIVDHTHWNWANANREQLGIAATEDPMQALFNKGWQRIVMLPGGAKVIATESNVRPNKAQMAELEDAAFERGALVFDAAGGVLIERPAGPDVAQFKPPGRTAEEVERMNPEDFSLWAKTLEGGITGEAARLGASLGPAAAEQLTRLHKESAEQSKRYMVDGDFDNAMAVVTKGQFFREAMEAATNTGSMATGREHGIVQFKPPREEREGMAGVQREREIKKFGSLSVPPPEQTAEKQLGIPEGAPPAKGGFARQQVIRQEAQAESEQFKPGKARVEPRGKKQELKLKKPGQDGVSKAWILPNGDVKQLGGTWHQQWLHENPDVSKQFGIVVEKFAGADVTGEREQALAKGFVRVNYASNQGRMVIEARVKDWRYQKDPVFDLIETNIKNIDNLTILLYDDAVKKVVDSASEQLFLADSPKEALANIPFITGREIGASGEKGVQFKPAEDTSNRTLFSASLFFPGEVSRIRKAAAGEGGTFDVSGEPWGAPRNQKIDLVTLASVNVPRGELTQERIQQAMEAHKAALEARDLLAGVFNFDDKKTGAPMTSIDVNAPVPQEHRANSVEFAKDNDQISIWDASKFEEVKTGGSGNTRLKTPEQIAVAAALLQQGKPVDVSRILNKYPELAPGDRPAREYNRHLTATLTQQQLRDYFPEAVVPRDKNTMSPSDIVHAPLLKGLKTDAEKVERFAGELVKDAETLKDTAPFQTGSRWYSEFVPTLKQEFGEWAPKFTQLLAATSPQTNPELNFRWSYEAMRQWQSGAFDATIRKYREGLDIVKNDQWMDWLQKEHEAGRIEDLPAKPSAATFLAEWVERHNLKPKRANGMLFGAHGMAILKVLAEIWLEENKGLKTNQFLKNLLGEHHGATVDVWANRTMRRLGYKGFVPRWRILPKREGAVPDPDFEFSQKVFATAATKMGMLPDALQGAMWFAEKLIWFRNGWGDLEFGNFASELEKIPKLEKRVQSERAGKAPVEPREETE